MIVDAKFKSFGCGTAIASSDMMVELCLGKKVQEAVKITNIDVEKALRDDPDTPAVPGQKMHCSVMGYEALEDALKNWDNYTDLDDLRNEEALNKTSEKIVCTCFGITENEIWDAIKINGLKTVEEVTNYTKAGGACGRCKSIIQDMIDTYYKKEKEVKTLSPAQKIIKINNIIEKQISPELMKDGGDITLVDVQGDKVMVKLRGKCSGCKNSTLTLKTFVETTLKNTVDKNIEVVEV